MKNQNLYLVTDLLFLGVLLLLLTSALLTLLTVCVCFLGNGLCQFRSDGAHFTNERLTRQFCFPASNYHGASRARARAAASASALL